MKIIEFYKVVEGATEFRMTSSDTDITYLGQVYTATAIGRSEAESKNEISRSNIEVSLNIDNTLAQRYLNTVVDSVVSLTVFSQQDTDVSVTWKGRLSSVKTEGAVVKLIFESIFTSLRRPGLRRRYQRNCGHVLYGRGCRLNKDAFANPGVATAAAGATLTIPLAAGKPDGYYTGGMVKAPDGTLRFIISHSGTQIGLIRQIDSLNTAIVGGAQNVTLYPGCDRTRTMCKDRFNNLQNNGSFAFIPTRNPFTGSSFT